MSSQSIQIYRDDAVSPIAISAWEQALTQCLDMRYYQINPLTPQDESKDYRNVAMTVIPGGYTPNIANNLSSVALQIQGAVNGGAGFIGSCAGTLAVSSSVHLVAKKNGETFYVKPRSCFADASGLNLCTANAFAPFYTPGDFLRGLRDERNIQPITTSWSEDWPDKVGQSESIATATKISNIYHACGPCFSLSGLSAEERSRYAVLAHYKNNGTVPQKLEGPHHGAEPIAT
jgi:hypothetical protein